MSDLCRMVSVNDGLTNADILIDISKDEDPSSASIDLSDVDSAISLVPLDRGFGTVYSDMVLSIANLVA